MPRRTHEGCSLMYEVHKKNVLRRGVHHVVFAVHGKA